MSDAFKLQSFKIYNFLKSDFAKSFFVINEDRIFVYAFPLLFHSAFVKQRRFLVPFPLRKLNCSPIFGEFMLLTLAIIAGYLDDVAHKTDQSIAVAKCCLLFSAA